MDKNLLIAVIPKNLELQRHELRPSEIGEQRLEIALRGKQVRNCSINEIKAVLRLIMLKVGIRANNLPNNAEKAVLIDHIITNYGGHTIYEIRLAFQMAITGKLGLDPVPYENFSCLYFSSIMEAYRSWAKDAIKQLPVKVEQVIYTDEEMLDMRRGEIEAAFQAMKNGYMPLIHTYFAEVLIADNWMGEDESIEVFFVNALATVENLYFKA